MPIQGNTNQSRLKNIGITAFQSQQPLEPEEESLSGVHIFKDHRLLRFKSARGASPLYQHSISPWTGFWQALPISSLAQDGGQGRDRHRFGTGFRARTARSALKNVGLLLMN